MKHIHTISFLGLLWKAFDNHDKLIGTGFLDHNKKARYFENIPITYYNSTTQHQIPPYEVLDDVNNYITLLTKK
jgi:hypothetical protein